MPVTRDWIEGMKLVRGSVRLIALRWTLWILAALPGVAAARGSFSDSIANRPYFAEAPEPLSVIRLGSLLGAVSGAVWGALAVGVLIAWLGNLLLTAGAIDLLRPTAAGGRVAVWRKIFDTGTRFLWIYLRIALLAGLLVVLGSRLLSLIFERLGDHGTLAGWTAKTLLVTLPTTRVLLLVLWMGLVGVFVLWCRVIAVNDNRRYVRRLPSIVLRLWWRRPLRAVFPHWVLSLGTLVLSAGILAAWRQSSAALAVWVVLWLVALELQAYVWHWRVRASNLIWARDELAGLRRHPDEPWHWLARLRRRFLSKGAKPQPEPVRDERASLEG